MAINTKQKGYEVDGARGASKCACDRSEVMDPGRAVPPSSSHLNVPSELWLTTGEGKQPGQSSTTDQSEFIVANTYRLTNKICSGSFGEIRIGENIENGTKVAVKMEKIKDTRLPQLLIEYRVYQRFNNSEKGFPLIYFYGKCQDYNVLVMQLLGKNLEQVFDLCQRQFSLKSIVHIAIELITRFRCIHGYGIVYRDVKPENFVFSMDKSECNVIYVVDFGLAKPFMDTATGKHIPMQQSCVITGTARYMSLNAHQGREHSRRDDLESIGYVLVYFLRQGKLPWSGLRENKPKERYKKIYEYKCSMPIETLCHGFPSEFADYLRYCRALDFEQEPKYQELKDMFVELFKQQFKKDGVFDWTNKLK